MACLMDQQVSTQAEHGELRIKPQNWRKSEQDVYWKSKSELFCYLIVTWYIPKNLNSTFIDPLFQKTIVLIMVQEPMH